ncbi:MAG: hypothetical protein RIB84_18590 [Sneathiellaceae bacterium]
MTENYKKGSFSFPGAIGLGTGVMIGAGIFAPTGQVADYAGLWFPAAFVLAAAISGFSACSCAKLSYAHPSTGGIGMYLQKAYGRSTTAGAGALLMAFSMVINESLVARSFGTYAQRLFGMPVGLSAPGILAVFTAERWFLKSRRQSLGHAKGHGGGKP